MDVRSPLVIGTHELGRRPGAMRTEVRVVPAPPDLGNEVIRVSPGSDIELDLRLESVMDGVFVTGTAATRAQGECVRCLGDVTKDIDVEFSELFLYQDAESFLPSEEGEDVEELHVVEDEHLDLEPPLRDALVTVLPFQPLCRPDCGGLCSLCGERMDDLEPGHVHEQRDPRWSALASLLDESATPDSGEEAGEGR